MQEVSITDGLPARNAELERLRERRIAPARSRHQPDQCNNLGQFLEHERQEIELLVELDAALEAHRKAMDELADAMRLLRESLLSQEDL
jgi:D-serine deaminase-like pyridoxal phosphate-dependent protein